MKTKYVEAKFNHCWEALKAFEEGEELYIVITSTQDGFEYKQLESKSKVVDLWDAVFKKERVDWHKVAYDFIDESDYMNIEDTFDLTTMPPSEEAGRKWDQEFLELCRVILRATGELE